MQSTLRWWVIGTVALSLVACARPPAQTDGIAGAPAAQSRGPKVLTKKSLLVPSGVVAVAVLAFPVLRSAVFRSGRPAANAASAEVVQPADDPPAVHPVRVEVVKPKPGGMERTTTQPGSVHAYEYEDIFAKVSGYLKGQSLDIGSPVKKGQLLAVIDAPELEKEVQQLRAKCGG